MVCIECALYLCRSVGFTNQFRRLVCYDFRARYEECIHLGDLRSQGRRCERQSLRRCVHWRLKRFEWFRRFKRLGDFDWAKGTLRFTADHPVPDGLLRDIFTARIAEIEAKTGTRPASD